MIEGWQLRWQQYHRFHRWIRVGEIRRAPKCGDAAFAGRLSVLGNSLRQNEDFFCHVGVASDYPTPGTAAAPMVMRVAELRGLIRHAFSAKEKQARRATSGPSLLLSMTHRAVSAENVGWDEEVVRSRQTFATSRTAMQKTFFSLARALGWIGQVDDASGCVVETDGGVRLTEQDDELGMLATKFFSATCDTLETRRGGKLNSIRFGGGSRRSSRLIRQSVSTFHFGSPGWARFDGGSLAYCRGGCSTIDSATYRCGRPNYLRVHELLRSVHRRRNLERAFSHRNCDSTQPADELPESVREWPQRKIRVGYLGAISTRIRVGKIITDFAIA